MSKNAFSTNHQTMTKIVNGLINSRPEYSGVIPTIKADGTWPKAGENYQRVPGTYNSFLTSMLEQYAVREVKRLIMGEHEFSKFFKTGAQRMFENIHIAPIKPKPYTGEFDVAREFGKQLPDVDTEFHIVNYHAQYTVTVNHIQSKSAFDSLDNMLTFYEQVVNNMFESAKKVDYILMGRQLIKAIARGKMAPVVTGSQPKEIIETVRTMMVEMGAPRPMFNAAHRDGVKSSVESIELFLQAKDSARADVDVLANAFNIDKTTWMGNKHVLPNWQYFYNSKDLKDLERAGFVDPISEEEFNLVKDNVLAVMVDTDWFIFENVTYEVTQNNPASTPRQTNMFLTDEKIISSNSFANAVVLVKNEAQAPETFKFVVTSVEGGHNNIKRLALNPVAQVGFYNDKAKLTAQDSDVQAGIVVDKAGIVTFTEKGQSTTLKLVLPYIDREGLETEIVYTAATTLKPSDIVGTEITFNKG